MGEEENIILTGEIPKKSSKITFNMEDAEDEEVAEEDVKAAHDEAVNERYMARRERNKMAATEKVGDTGMYTSISAY